MSKEKKTEEKVGKAEKAEKLEKDTVEENKDTAEKSTESGADLDSEALKSQLEDKSKKCEEYMGMLQRMAAEFDNYKKRTTREKEAVYSDTVADVIAAFLPVVDNFERALQAAGREDDSEKNDVQSLKSGIDMVFRQMKDVMKNLGVEEIKALGEQFDPQLHNAVMHVEDETQGENVVLEEFQKGYMIKDKVIRHSMVKVAN